MKEKEKEEDEIYIFSRFIVWNKDRDLKPSMVFKTGRELEGVLVAGEVPGQTEPPR